MKLSDRVFKCGCCVDKDCDVHAAKNIVWFYHNDLGVSCTDVKRVELKPIVEAFYSNQAQTVKHEDLSL